MDSQIDRQLDIKKIDGQLNIKKIDRQLDIKKIDRQLDIKKIDSMEGSYQEVPPKKIIMINFHGQEMFNGKLSIM